VRLHVWSAYNFADFTTKVKSKGGAGNIHIVVNDQEMLAIAVPAQPRPAGVAATSEPGTFEMQPVDPTPPPEPHDLPEGVEAPKPIDTASSAPDAAAETTSSTEPPPSGPQPDTESEPLELITGSWT
jgi:hypothetical protein